MATLAELTGLSPRESGPSLEDTAAPAPKLPTIDDLKRSAIEKGVDPEFAVSLLGQESGGNWKTKDSAKGARGGMQVMPGTFKQMLPDGNPDDPWDNMEAGLRYIAHGQKVLGTTDPKLLAAGYHQGYGRPELKRGIIADTTDGAKRTRDYANDVAGRMGGGNGGGTTASKPTAASLLGVDLDVVHLSAPERRASTPPAEGKLDLVGALKKGAAGLKVTWDYLANALERGVTGGEADTGKILQASAEEYQRIASDPRLAEVVRLGNEAPGWGEAAWEMTKYLAENPTAVANFLAEQAPGMVAALPFGLAGGAVTGRIAGAAASKAGVAAGTRAAVGKAASMSGFGASLNASQTALMSLGGNYAEGLQKFGGDVERAREYATTKTVAEVPANAIAGAFMAVNPFKSIVANTALQATAQGLGGAVGAHQAATSVGETAGKGELLMEFGGEFLTAPSDVAMEKFGNKKAAAPGASDTGALPSTDVLDSLGTQNPAQPAATPEAGSQAPAASPKDETIAQAGDVLRSELDAPDPNAALTTPVPGDALARVDEIDKQIAAATDPQAAAALTQERAKLTANWPKMEVGRAAPFVTETGANLDAQYAIVDAGSLVASHDTNLRQNKAYPQELQPRDRERAASEVQIAGIVGNLSPARLGASADAANGAPIVGADGLVESGNARTIALQRVYQANGAKAQSYRDWLVANADTFGFTSDQVAGMAKPVLVRVRRTPVNRAEFARQANAPTTAVMSPLETARSDAARLGDLDDFTPDDSGEFTGAGNRGFVRRFVGGLATTEQAGLIGADGQLSQSGYARIRNAVLARAYGESPVLQRMVESLDNNLRNITGALVRVAPAVAKARDSIAAGAMFDRDITENVVAAVEKLSQLRSEGKSVAEYLAQSGMFGGALAPETADILGFLDQNIRAPKRIAEFLQAYLDVLASAGNPNQDSLFGGAEAPAKQDIINLAKERAKRESDRGGVQDSEGDAAGKDAGGSAGDAGGGAAGDSRDQRTGTEGRVRLSRKAGGEGGVDPNADAARSGAPQEQRRGSERVREEGVREVPDGDPGGSAPRDPLTEAPPSEGLASDADGKSAGTAGPEVPPQEFATQVIKALGQSGTLFQQPKSDKTTLTAIAADIDPGMKVSAMAPTSPRLERVVTVTMPDGAKAMVRIYKDGAVDLDASLLTEGSSRGTALYNLVATFAHNTGKLFIGDPNGLSDAGLYRRTENMIASAVKFGTTEHLYPHERQIAEGLQWSDEKGADNLGNLLMFSRDLLAKAMPESADLVYNFETQQFEGVADGKPLTDADLKLLARDSRGAATARAGYSTLKRAALLNTLVRGTGEADRRRILGQVVRQLREGIDPNLQRSFYSRKAQTAPPRKSASAAPAANPTQAPPSAGLSVSALRTELSKILAQAKRLPAGGVKMVQSVADLPAGLLDFLRSENAESEVEGIYDPATKTVWLVADHLPTAARAEQVLFHELYGHFGLQGLFGKGMAAALRDLVARNKNLRKRVSELRADHGYSEDIANEEAVVEFAERGESLEGLRRFVAAFQRMLRERGFERMADWMEGLTDAEAMTVVAEARRFVRGEVESNAIKGARVAAAERAVYGVTEPTALSGDLFPESLTNVRLPQEARGPARQPIAATPAPNVHAATALSVREAPETPGLYFVETELVTVGERESPVNRVTTPEEAALATSYLTRYAVEHVDVLVTDAKGKPLAVVGALKDDRASVTVPVPSIVAEISRIDGAANFWFVHNHPSGHSTLSDADRRLSIGIQSQLKNIGVTYQGMLAVGRRQRDIEYSYLSPDGKTGVTAAPLKAAATGKYRVPIVERMILERSRAGKLISDPASAIAVAEAMSKHGSGILFLTTQNEVAAYVPLAPSDTMPLRQDGRAMRLFRAASKSGAHSAIIVSSNRKGPAYSTGQMENLQAALTSVAEISVHDWIVFDTKSGKPYSMRGQGLQRGRPGGFLSRPDKWVYSQLARVASEKGSTATPAEWKHRLAAWVKTGTVKADEVEWSGLTDWLGTREGKVTTDDVLGFLRENGVRVEEVATRETIDRALENELYRLALEQQSSGNESPFVGAILSGESSDSIVRRATDEDPVEMVGLARRINAEIAGGKPRYAQYQLPGGTNYREVLLTLPEKPVDAQATADQRAYFDFIDQLKSRHGDNWRSLAPVADRIKASDLESAAKASRPRDAANPDGVASPKQDNANYRSPHWDAPNVLAHIRLNDRTDSEGRRVLFVEEIQSDWAQQGRKSGFKGKTQEDAQRFFGIADDVWAQTSDDDREAYRAEMVASKGRDVVPAAPFVGKTDAWVSLALKRVVRMAAEGGYDAVAFVTGEQAVDRFALSNTISRVTYVVGRLTAYDLAGKVVFNESVERDKVQDYIGKDVATRLLESNPVEKKIPGGTIRLREVSGLQLKAGGEGMRAFYGDEKGGVYGKTGKDGKPIVPIVQKIAKDVLKKVGGGAMTTITIDVQGHPEDAQGLMEVREWQGPELLVPDVRWAANNEDLPVAVRQQLRDIADRMRDGVPQDRAIREWGSISAARALGGDLVAKAAHMVGQPGFLIAPAMREKAMAGVPLFSRKAIAQPSQTAQPRQSAQGAPNNASRPAAGAASTVAAAPVSPGSWTADEPSRLDNIIYSLQDKLVDTRRVLQAIKAWTGKVAEWMDPYLQEELYHGRTAKRVEEFANDELRPMLLEMQRRGITVAEFEEFLHARHAEERNEQIAKVNPAMPDGGSGMKTADARARLAAIPAAKRRDLDVLAKHIDGITTETRAILVGYGLESADTMAAWEGAYKHYVPLMREDMDTGFATNGTGVGFSVRGSASKRATGSSRAVTSIIGNLALQRERAIVRGEKNRVATALWGLAKMNPNPDFWKVDAPPKIKTVSAVTGLVEERPDPTYKGRDNVIVARIPDPKTGEVHERSIVFNERSERAMRMAAALKNLDADRLGLFLGISARITRYFAAINTQYNPVFGVVNLIRDVQGAMFNLTNTPLAGRQVEVSKNIMAAMRGVYVQERSGRKGRHAGSQWSALWEEFQKEGGQTGYRDMFATGEERAKALQKEVAALTHGKLRKGAHAFFDWLSDYNSAIENSVRLAAYKSGIDAGLSKQKAASIAKNLTVNFNRKGQAATQVGAMYAFFNASMQGTARLAQTLSGPSGRKIMAGGVMLGVVQAVALSMAGFDDDEPPDFIRERNLVIPVGGGRYVSIPMPLGLHVLPNIGRIVTEFALGGLTRPGERVVELLGVLAEAFNPIGSAGMSLQTITPTAVDPLAALAENKDWTGKPIYREDFNRLAPTPGFTRTKDTASSWAKGLAWVVNRATGGTDFQQGLWSPTPDQFDYLIGQATGGVGREVSKAWQAGASVYTGEDLPTYKIPLVGRLIGSTEGQSSQANRFYSNLTAMAEHEAEIKGRTRIGEDVQGYVKAHPEARLWAEANAAEQAVAKLRKAKRAFIEDDRPNEQIAEMDKRMAAVMTRLNERVKAARAQQQ